MLVLCEYCMSHTCICAGPNKQLRENSKRPIIPQKHRLL